MSSNSGFNQSHDLITREILLNIQDDDDLANAIVTDSKAHQIASQPRFWQERLELYYPSFVEDRMEFSNLTNREFYILISLFKSFKITLNNGGFIYDDNDTSDDSDTSDSEQEDNNTNFNFDNLLNALTQNQNINSPDMTNFNFVLPTPIGNNNDPLDKYPHYRHNITIAKRLGKYLYNIYNRLNIDKMFSEEFLVKLLVKNRRATYIESLIYARIISYMLQLFELDINPDALFDAELESPQAQFILQYNNSANQRTGLFSDIDEGMYIGWD